MLGRFQHFLLVLNTPLKLLVVQPPFRIRAAAPCAGTSARRIGQHEIHLPCQWVQCIEISMDLRVTHPSTL